MVIANVVLILNLTKKIILPFIAKLLLISVALYLDLGIMTYVFQTIIHIWNFFQIPILIIIAIGIMYLSFKKN
jgi:hypothetical protein